MADKILVTDEQGAVSEDGAQTNPLFGASARVGATASCTVAPPAGKVSASVTLIARSDENPNGEANVGLSLDEAGPYSPGDTGLELTDFSAPLTLWVKALGVCTNPGLVSEYAGFVDLAQVSGVAQSTSAAIGDVEVGGVEEVGGTAQSTSAATGNVVEVAPVSGAAASTSASSGAAPAVAQILSGAVMDLRASRADDDGTPHTNTDPDKAVWYDLSGNDISPDLTSFAFTPSSGWAGAGTAADPYCLVTNGTANTIKVMDNLSSWVNLSTGFTVEMWAKIAANTVDYAGLYETLSPTGGFGITWGASTAQGKPIARLRTTGGANTDVTYPTAIDDGNWHLIRAEFKSGTAGLTISVDNGSAYTANATGAYSLANGHELFITGDGGSTNFVGMSIAHFRVYSGILTTQQKADNYAAGYVV